MWRQHKWAVISLIILIVGFSLSRFQTPVSSDLTGNLEVHFIDVGQGESIFIRTPEGLTALIDGGPSKDRALAYLQSQSISQIDIMILTHPHQDHVQGLAAVVHSLKVGGVWTSGASSTTRAYENFLDAIEARKVPYHEVKTGETIPLGQLTFQVLYGVSRAPNPNNTSLVLRLEYGKTSFLLTGDAEKPVEQTLVKTSANLLPSTVLKIGHHGSSTSSWPAFVKAVAPEIAIYSAGKNNRYGHPTLKTLNTFDSLNIPVYGTDRLGTIIVISDGSELRIYNK